ncbi:MAG: threonine synthase [Clostridiales bacterium 36_14]|nr:MAG: threonine synthase [Clostridiales bacterium 36_14]
MDLLYSSTRNGEEKVTASKAILKGLADDGGLFVPESIPKLDVTIEELAKMSYQETAYAVMKLFFTDFTEEELKNCINKAYDSKFDTDEIAPLVEADGAYYLELFHGATIAFKDMALSILPHLLTTAAKKNQVNNEIVILTATSGDTGKAALAGFADVEGTKIVVFYPKDGVSPIQKQQMVTQKGDNTYVVGINGNFDQAQTGVKKMFSDKELAKELDAAGYQFSSANSINIGRFIPQITYYVYAYAKSYANGKIAKDEKINIVVPTGNFGNILSAFYAKNMGLPVAKLICASNENKVLYDFFETGKYDKNREFILTSSPSMDILISSNLERLIYWAAGNDAKKNVEFMTALTKEGVYEITPQMQEKLKDFYGNYASEEETAEAIRTLYEKTGYILDTHTAVASSVYGKYKAETKDDQTTTVIASTASPFKFSRSVMDAIEEIRNAPVRHKATCEVDEMPRVVKEFLGM